MFIQFDISCERIYLGGMRSGGRGGGGKREEKGRKGGVGRLFMPDTKTYKCIVLAFLIPRYVEYTNNNWDISSLVGAVVNDRYISKLNSNRDIVLCKKEA